MIVLDASAVIEWLLGTSRGDRIDRRLFSKPVALQAPHLLDVEVAQVLRRYARDGIVTVQRGQEALEDLGDLSLHRYPPEVKWCRERHSHPHSMMGHWSATLSR